MIMTHCSKCVFRQNSFCTIKNKDCVVLDDQFCMPGFCIFARDRQWADKHQNQDLHNIARQECRFRYDQIIIFDEHIHTEDHLHRSIQSDGQRYKRVIIVDVTGNDARTGIVRKYTSELRIPYFVEQMVEHVTDLYKAINTVVRLVSQPYFGVIDAGSVFFDATELILISLSKDDPIAYWPFARHFSTQSYIGFYLTDAFRQLGGHNNNSFHNKLLQHQDADCKIISHIGVGSC